MSSSDEDKWLSFASSTGSCGVGGGKDVEADAIGESARGTGTLAVFAGEVLGVDEVGFEAVDCENA